MGLVAGQQNVFDGVIDALEKGEKRILIKGSAGTGKTYLSSELVKHFRRSYTINRSSNNGMVYVTAPTNKALAILKGKINVDVVFKTIHSALRVKAWKDNKTGKVSFVADKSSKDKDFQFCKVCIIDECSMLETYILGLLDNYLHFPIIFIGDDKQINPVGEDKSPIFDKGYKTFELTEIIRQGKGNPIIDLSRDLEMIHFKFPNLVEGKGYVYNEYRPQLIEDLAEVNGTDELKYLAWTNADIDEMNVLVRKKRYGNPARIEKEETLVFNTPYGPYYTNKEVKVEELRIIQGLVPIPREDTIFDRNGIPASRTDFIKLKYYHINNSFKIIHEDSDYIYKTIVDTLKDNAKNHGWGWLGYYFFIEQFADIKYNHAISVHKSQGSTYKQTIINVGNIMFNQKIEERDRLLYTAVTRASDLVILNNVR